jgi:hypothetical protein
MRKIIILFILILSSCAVNRGESSIPNTEIPLSTIDMNIPPKWTETITPTITTEKDNGLTEPTEINDWTPTQKLQSDCSLQEIESYINTVLPLADQHSVDALIAQKMEELTDKEYIKELQKKASERIEALDGISVPSCAEEVHIIIRSSFELLESTWQLILIEDYEKARDKLRESYEALGEGIALLDLLKQNQ